LGRVGKGMSWSSGAVLFVFCVCFLWEEVGGADGVTSD